MGVTSSRLTFLSVLVISKDCETEKLPLIESTRIGGTFPFLLFLLSFVDAHWREMGLRPLSRLLVRVD